MKISHRQFYIAGFLFLLVMDTFSQVCFKIAATHAEPFVASTEWLLRVVMDPWGYGSIIGYIGAFLVWMTMLREIPVGPAFAASHLEVIGVMIISVPLFGEHLNLLQYFGAALIVVGVGCLAYSEPKETDRSKHA